MTKREEELAAAIKRAARELDRWADDMIADGALFGSHEDALAARLRAIAAGLTGALVRHPDEPDLAPRPWHQQGVKERESDRL